MFYENAASASVSLLQFRVEAGEGVAGRSIGKTIEVKFTAEQANMLSLDFWFCPLTAVTDSQWAN